MKHRRPVPYDRFRCGLSFAAVRQELGLEQRAQRSAGLYMYVTRRTVLGRMAQYKREAYAHYLAELADGES